MQKRDDIFQYFLKGMERETQAQLRLWFTHQMMIDEINRKKELEQLKEEIVEEVLARIYLTIDASDVIAKIEELDEAIKKLGK